jgi:serine/threonine-protein kinase
MSVTGPVGRLRALEVGAQLAGKLKLVRPIGEGGMGAVWLARNIATGAHVAIKVLRPDRKEDELTAARFKYEAKLGAMLGHRNITRVFDLLQDDDGSLILVMEYLEGETLRAYYRRLGSLPTREAVAIMVAVLSGLQHAHEHNVVHRDLKPTNIVLHVDSDGIMTPKLLDFGIAKAPDSTIETRTGDSLGTPSYMSPEQVRSINLDGRSDLFSVAVVLYEIITGANPFPGPTPTAVLAQVLELEIDPDPKIDPRVWLEIQRALSKQAYQRHASAKQFAAALCTAVGEGETGLVQSLRRDAPPTSSVPDSFNEPGTDPDLHSGEITGTQTATATATAAMDTVKLPVRAFRRPLVAAGAAAVLLTAGLIVFRGSSAPQGPPTPQPTASTSVLAASATLGGGAPALDPATSSTVVELGDMPPAPVGAGGDYPHPSPNPPTTVRRPKQTKPAGSSKSIARTPGF